MSNSLISGEFCEIGCVCQCSGQVESCHRNDKRNPSSIMVRYQNAAITSKYAVITHRSLRWRFLCFFGLAFALRFLGLPCALRCRFRCALSAQLFLTKKIEYFNCRYASGQIWYKVSVLSYFRKSSAKVGLGGYANLELRN